MPTIQNPPQPVETQPMLPVPEPPKRKVEPVVDLNFERSRRRFAEGA